MTHFKIGDRVRALPRAKPDHVRGVEGIVESVDPCNEGTVYGVGFVNGALYGMSMGGRVFGDELELVVYPPEAALTREMLLPADSAARKDIPIATGVMDYFPLALAYIARVSKAGNDKHNPGQPLHWAKDKSKDHADCIARHLVDRGTIDPEDGLLHEGKLAWRALAMLETALGNGSTP